MPGSRCTVTQDHMATGACAGLVHGLVTRADWHTRRPVLHLSPTPDQGITDHMGHRRWTCRETLGCWLTSTRSKQSRRIRKLGHLHHRRFVITPKKPYKIKNDADTSVFLCSRHRQDLKKFLEHKKTSSIRVSCSPFGNMAVLKVVKLFYSMALGLR